MGHDVSLDLCTDVDFSKREIPTTMNLALVKPVCVGQLVTLTAKVATLLPAKESPSGLKYRKTVIVDPYATMKWTLWSSFTKSVSEGKTCIHI